MEVQCDVKPEKVVKVNWLNVITLDFWGTNTIKGNYNDQNKFFFILNKPKTYLTQKKIKSKAIYKVSPELEKCQNEQQ